MAKTKKPDGNGSSRATARSLDELSIAELKARKARALELIAELRALVPGTVTLTEDERRHSLGRLRDGEHDALRLVLDVVDSAPKYFESLADEDEGHEPGRFETNLLRDRLARREILAEIQQAIEPVATGLADTVLHLGGQVRPAVLAAYRIAKTVSRTDRKLRSALSGAIDFYSAPARAAAKTRARTQPKG
jgi:hypothetical protein